MIQPTKMTKMIRTPRFFANQRLPTQSLHKGGQRSKTLSTTTTGILASCHWEQGSQGRRRRRKCSQEHWSASEHWIKSDKRRSSGRRRGERRRGERRRGERRRGGGESTTSLKSPEHPFLKGSLPISQVLRLRTLEERNFTSRLQKERRRSSRKGSRRWNVNRESCTRREGVNG